MSRLPTITYLFGEVEASTILWESYPEQMKVALKRYGEILREVVRDEGGRIVGMVGDACHAAFDGPSEALNAALTAQKALFAEEWVRPMNLRTRMALHTEVREETGDKDNSGSLVDRCSRLVCAGHGGQILLSGATFEAVRDDLALIDTEARMVDLGEYQLGVATYPDRVFQLAIPDLPGRFPPLRAAEGSSDLLDRRYRITDFLGSGGMAKVYLARDERLGRDVAIKVLLPRYAEDEEFVKRFEREARSAASLSHPNIVQVHDRGEREVGAPYIVMEYLPGGTLKDLILASAPLPPRRAAELSLQIAVALSEAHEKGFVHRDVKPQNVLLDGRGGLKVADFGIARAVDATTLTSTGLVLGTPHYIAPEQSEGKPAGPRSDLYALGVIFYEMLTGELPFEADTPAGVLSRQLRGDLRSPRELNPDVPQGMDAVAVRLLARNPDDRHRGATEFIEELQRVVGWRDGSVPAERRSGAMSGEVELSGTEMVDATLSPVVRVPDLTGQDAFRASDMLADVGLTLGDQEEVASESAPRGKIVAQSLNAGEETERGGLVGVTVSSGPEPAGIERAEQEARRVVEEDPADGRSSGQEREARDKRSAQPEDRGQGQLPPGHGGSDEVGRRATFRRQSGAGCLVRVIVALVLLVFILALLARFGQAAEVSSVKDQTLRPARDGVVESGLAGFRRSSDWPEENIANQNSEPGAEVVRGSRVSVVLSASLEMVSMPSTAGQTRN